MTSDAEIGQEIVDTTHVIVEDNIQVTKLARDFRLSKFGELTNFTVDFANLSFLQAANALETYAQQRDAWIEPYMLYEKPYWAIYSAGAKNLVDGDGRCTSGVPLSLCQNDSWLQTQYQVIQITCGCELAGLAVSMCDNMTTYLNAGQASAEATFTNKALLYYGGIFAGVSVGVLLVAGCGCYYGRKWHRNRRKQAVSPTTKTVEKE
ncbi:hypothetical protein SDRG_10603 [Saprolegnia diclina VS20]|uniref:Uncharacterized protein n=1 Tax=Saprolegnia diclina (strain VS20) TaxID=1156394 RepID=T0Q1U1_SAPDV|nr:hypothetical protein SDRG_10603 [Saprolegnia diclina VS20]EQC31814.1 hypothetical protein SDRG_10603 [Saprolegnia diclina VS20]|eukprot:XP_008614821.1 hypothetical protein SDRG_10603 [Saprolegnia diclina VS20]